MLSKVLRRSVQHHNPALFRQPVRAFAAGNSLWTKLEAAPPDPILGLNDAFKKDTHPKKVLLGMGAYRDNDGKPLILESFVDFTTEVSFLIARDKDGLITHFPATENHHEQGILAHSTAPASLEEAIIAKGQKAITDIAHHLDLFGILAMESFVNAQGDIIFNEIAPRPHNSFHWSIEGANCSQFEQLARIIAGLPMRQVTTTGQWRMENLLGQHGPQIPAFQAMDDVATHLYGKTEYKTGRKIGHITYALSDSLDKSYKVV